MFGDPVFESLDRSSAPKLSQIALSTLHNTITLPFVTITINSIGDLPYYNRHRRLHPLPFCSVDSDEEDLVGGYGQDSRRSGKQGSRSGKKRNSRSDDYSDSDQENRHPLDESIHRNRHRYRTDSHPTMAASTRNKSKSQNPKKGQQDAIDRQQAELDKLAKENQELKEKEALAQQRAKMVVISSSNGAEGQAMTALIKKVVNTDLWKNCKFIKNDKFAEKAAKLVLRKLNLQEMEGLQGDQLEAAQKIWLNANKSKICSMLNDRRNYVIQQLGVVFKEAAAANKLDTLPNVAEMKDLVLREGMDADVSKEQKAKMDALLDKYWDVLMPVVAGHKHWAPKQRWNSMMSFGKRDENDPNSEWLVHPSDEAFLLIAWENSYDRWTYKATAGDKFDDKDPQAKTKYSSSPLGTKAFGQWDPKGIKAFGDHQKAVLKQRLTNPDLQDPEGDVLFIKELETKALDRIRKANKYDADGPAKKKRKSSKKNAFDAEEPDMNDDDAW